MQKNNESRVVAEVVIDPTPQQLTEMSMFIEEWQTSKGLVLGAFAKRDGKYKIGFRQVPPELGNQILKIVDDFYSQNGEKKDAK